MKFAALMLLLMNAPSMGQSMASMDVASDLGTVLGSEEACELVYDQAQIARFIEENVSADDMSFASMLQTMVMGQEYQIQQMSPSAKTAHCTQIARVARSYGFAE